MIMQHWWSDSDRGKQKYSEKKSRAILPTVNNTCTCLVSIQDLRGEEPATNRPNHGTANHSTGPGIFESAKLSCTCFSGPIFLSNFIIFRKCASKQVAAGAILRTG